MTTARSIRWIFISEAVSRFGIIFIFSVLGHRLGPEGVGGYGQLTSLAALVLPLATFGLVSVFVRFFAGHSLGTRKRFELFRVFAGIFFGALVASILIAVFADELNRFILKASYGTDLFRLGAMFLLGSALEQGVIGYYRSQKLFKQLAVFGVVQTLVNVLCVVFFIHSNFEIGHGFLMIGAGKLICSFGVLLSLVLSKPLDKTSDDQVGLGVMISYGIPLAVSGIGLWLMNLSDRTVIGHYLSPQELGLYTATYSLALLLGALNVPLNHPFYPRIMERVVQGDANGLLLLVRSFQRYMLFLSVPALFFVSVQLPDLMSLVAGPKFVADQWVFVPIGVAVVLDQLNTPAVYTALCTDEVKFTRNVWLSCGFLNVALNALTVPFFGLRAAAGFTFVCFLLLDYLIFRKVSKRFHLEKAYCWRELPIVCLISFVSAWMASFSGNYFALALARLAISGTVFLFVCGFLLFAFKLLNSEDIRRLGHFFGFK